jgi:hypothetical protein
MPPPQSKAWSYFKRDVESKIVKCKLCNLEMTNTGGEQINKAMSIINLYYIIFFTGFREGTL